MAKPKSSGRKRGARPQPKAAKPTTAVRPEWDSNKTDLDRRYRLTQAEELKRLRVRCEDLERRAKSYAKHMAERQKIKLAARHAKALRLGEQPEDESLLSGHLDTEKKPLSPIKERHFEEVDGIGQNETRAGTAQKAPRRPLSTPGTAVVDFDAEMQQFEDMQAASGARLRKGASLSQDVPLTRPPFYVGRAPRKIFRARASPSLRSTPRTVVSPAATVVPAVLTGDRQRLPAGSLPSTPNFAASLDRLEARYRDVEASMMRINAGLTPLAAHAGASPAMGQPRSYAGYLEVLMDSVAKLTALVAQGTSKLEAETSARAALAESLSTANRRAEALEVDLLREREERERLRGELQQLRLTSEVQVAALRSDVAVMQRLKPAPDAAAVPLSIPPPAPRPAAPATAPAGPSAVATLLAAPARGAPGRHDVSAWLDALENRRVPPIDTPAAPTPLDPLKPFDRNWTSGAVKPPATPPSAAGGSSANSPPTPLEDAASTIVHPEAVELPAPRPRHSVPVPRPAPAGRSEHIWGVPATPPLAGSTPPAAEARRALWTGDPARRGAEAPPTVRKSAGSPLEEVAAAKGEAARTSESKGAETISLISSKRTPPSAIGHLSRSSGASTVRPPCFPPVPHARAQGKGEPDSMALAAYAPVATRLQL